VIVRTDQRPNELGDCAVLEVEDTGIGIAADKHHLLFEEFERIDPSVKPGLGLGLAISRRVARALGGEITVRSERGAGSTFTLWLPGR
jgi:signal transduction histidine kinase